MKKSPLFWIVAMILGLVAFTVVLNIVGQLFMQPYIFYSHAGGFPHHDLRVINISFLPFLFHLGLIILGWWVLKKANGEFIKKWVGMILLSIGAFSILPLIIAILVALIALYVISKSKKQSKNDLMINEPIIGSTPSYKQNTHHILDEWERKTLKEETK
ncbi:hypothetical protein AB3Z07_21890 [Metabacillus halosaccharovorans]|uniref:hypothetical protein n=1 Tax=Metabacillus halosaccharovorans TaxID=930124 RepID=UPI00203DC29B|nr:hypothetical protein [Metabacillus halosaccharovorans]MCM3439970.1 hypothetical protein [Metabacillus halosaccharovorans]